MTSKERNAYRFEESTVDVEHSLFSMSSTMSLPSLDQIDIIYLTIQIKFRLLQLIKM